jgi:TolA-binding protein
MTFLFVVLAIAVIAAVAVLITGRWSPSMGVSATGDYRPDLPDSPKFDLAVRGYRMDEVDAKIADLEQTIESMRAATPNTQRNSP